MRLPSGSLPLQVRRPASINVQGALLSRQPARCQAYEQNDAAQGPLAAWFDGKVWSNGEGVLQPDNAENAESRRAQPAENSSESPATSPPGDTPSSSNSLPAPAKRGRGRPRKRPAAAADNSEALGSQPASLSTGAAAPELPQASGPSSTQDCSSSSGAGAQASSASDAAACATPRRSAKAKRSPRAATSSRKAPLDVPGAASSGSCDAAGHLSSIAAEGAAGTADPGHPTPSGSDARAADQPASVPAGRRPGAPAGRLVDSEPPPLLPPEEVDRFLNDEEACSAMRSALEELSPSDNQPPATDVGRLAALSAGCTCVL